MLGKWTLSHPAIYALEISFSRQHSLSGPAGLKPPELRPNLKNLNMVFST